MVLRSIRVRPTRLLIFVVLCVIGASTVYPLLFMALNSFRSNNAYQVNPYGLPTSFGLGNFSDLLSSYPFAASLLDSVIVVVPAVALATLFSALAGFVFAKTPFRYSNALFYLMLSVILMPGVVLIIPLYVLVAHAGLANSFGWAILVYAAINIPFGTYLLRANFRSIPDGLIDAGQSGTRRVAPVLGYSPTDRPGRRCDSGDPDVPQCLDRVVHQHRAVAYAGRPRW